MSERQMVTSIKDVEISHKARYFFASSYIKKGDRVLDACCGVGYGTKMMADMTHADCFLAFDKSDEAILSAKLYFDVENIDFMQLPFEELDSSVEEFEVITCFEAIEHVDNPELLMQKLCRLLRSDGKIILSTPNERRMPWSKEKFPEHLRHFTAEQMIHMMTANGITNIIPFSQEKWSPCISLGDQGKFLIFVGVKS